MKKFLLWILLPLSSNLAHADTAAIQKCVETGYEALTNRKSIAVAVIDAKDTKIYLFGQAKQNQIFEIGSITKTFTANLLAQEILAGKLKLSDAIAKEFQKTDVPITYEQLTTHTSGIIGGNFKDFHSANPESPYEGLTLSIFKPLYAKTPLDKTPGTHYKYSNIGEGLLGYLIAEKENSNYENLVRQKIFSVLNMTNSYFTVPESEVGRFPKGNIAEENGQSQPYSHWNLADTMIDPAGGIRSTIDDMAKFARANLIKTSSPLNESVSLSQQPIRFIPEINQWIGMNWYTQKEDQTVWHNGSTIGFNSILALSRKWNVGIVALSDTGVFTSDGSLDTELEDLAFKCLK